MSAAAAREKQPGLARFKGKAGLAALIALVVIVSHGLGNAADDAGLNDLGFLAPVRSADGLADEAVVLASREDFAAAVAKGRDAVRRLPVQQSTVRKLGEVELASEGSEAWSNDTIRVAKVLGWRDTQAQARLLMVAAQDGDIAGAIDHIDAVLRRSEVSEEVFRAISAGIANDAIRGAMTSRLAENPPWRQSLLASVDTYGDAEATQNFAVMLLDLVEREEKALPKAEVDPVLSRLAALDLGTALSSTAARLDPVTASDQGLNDPDFGGLRDGARDPDAVIGPFEWKRGRAQGIVVTVGPREGVDNALNVRSRSRVRGVILFQSLRLDPGRYRLSFEKFGSPKKTEGLEWRVLCSGEPIDTPAGKDGSLQEWRAQSVAFVVPADCPIQRVELRTGRNLQGDTRQASFAGMRIIKL